VQDITRLILRLALRVTASGDAKSFPTILSNLQQVLIPHVLHCAQKQKSALKALFLNLVGRAGFEPATN
jgi:hypothetical protein